MRLIRLGALVGSVVLLVATTVSMVNQRAERSAEQQARVVATVLLADQAVDATIVRAMAVVDVAAVDTDPASMVRSFGDGTDACILDGGEARCTGPDLGTSPAFGEVVAASIDRSGPAVVVDDSTDSVLVAARGDVTSALRIPSSELIGASVADAARRNDAAVAVELSPEVAGTAGTSRTGPQANDGRLVVVDTLPLGSNGGSVRVTVSVPDDAGIADGGLAAYALLLALGTILMALAGWTFLLDRRTLERRATTDDLTGLPNRREFERQTEEELLTAERFNTGVCVMLIDLNGFKQINDTLGHQFGDLVLRAAAKRLREAVRDTDVVGRWGGDEFVILLPGVQDASAVRSSAERIGGLLGGTPIAGDVSVGAAIGAALFPRHGQTLDELIRAADEAMYEAKTTGVTHRLADPLGGTHQEVDLRPGYSGPDRRRRAVGDTESV
jgi:diguanylate cyclase (GGDEF)-like protein